MEEALDRILELRPVHFAWRGGEDGGTQTGLIAQEVARILPDAVRRTDKGMLSVDYEAVSMVLLRAVQELTEDVRRLEAAVGSGR